MPFKSWTVASAWVVPEKAGVPSSVISSPLVPLSSTAKSSGVAGWAGGGVATICVVAWAAAGVAWTFPALSVATL